MLTYHSSQVLQKFFTCVVKWWKVHLLQSFGLNIFYSEEKDWARHTTRQCPLQDYNVLRLHLLIFNLSAVYPLELLLSLDDADQRNNRELLGDASDGFHMPKFSVIQGCWNILCLLFVAYRILYVISLFVELSTLCLQIFVWVILGLDLYLMCMISLYYA